MIWMIPILIGTITGILSACGIGGGSLLLIYLTQVVEIEQTVAQGINLLYFLPVGLVALPLHKKSGFLDNTVILYGSIGGILGSMFGSFLANSIETYFLQKLFSWFLLLVGSYTLFQKTN